MITENDIFPIGQAYKPHAIHGELSCSFTNTVFDDVDAPFFVIEVDGIFVPFFLESYRFKTNTTALVKFVGIDTGNEANELSNKTIYLPIEYRDQSTEENFTLQDFIGFEAIDMQKGLLGTIDDVDETTINVLFCINNDELLIPANDAFIENIDYSARKIYLNIPPELLEL